jgi:hypothetical protein
LRALEKLLGTRLQIVAHHMIREFDNVNHRGSYLAQLLLLHSFRAYLLRVLPKQLKIGGTVVFNWLVFPTYFAHRKRKRDAEPGLKEGRRGGLALMWLRRNSQVSLASRLRLAREVIAASLATRRAYTRIGLKRQ